MIQRTPRVKIMDRMMTEEPVDSPCIKVCVVDLQTEHCIGCGRSRAEIAGWVGLSSDEKRNVISLLPQRLVDMTAGRRRKGGRGMRRNELNEC